jgi:hypothetical protein
MAGSGATDVVPWNQTLKNWDESVMNATHDSEAFFNLVVVTQDGSSQMGHLESIAHVEDGRIQQVLESIPARLPSHYFALVGRLPAGGTERWSLSRKWRMRLRVESDEHHGNARADQKATSGRYPHESKPIEQRARECSIDPYAKVSVHDVKNRDKEALAAFASNPISCLRIGLRSVKLCDGTNTRSGAFDFASLLIEVKKEVTKRRAES